MLRRSPSRLAGILFLVLAVLLPARADAQNIAVLRIESLDAATADVERVMAVAGAPMDEGALMGLLQKGTGLEDLSWLDRTRPMAMVFPMEGMMLGAKGLVSTVPVADADAALAVMVEMFGPSEMDAKGIRQFTAGEGGAMLAVSVNDGHLVIGQSRDLVANLDLGGVLDATGHPPGNIVLDIHLEPIAPMALMGLQAGRQMVEQQMQKEEQEAEGKQDESEMQEPDVDPAMVMGIVDIYFDLVRDLLNNASRIQISLELAAEDIVLHERLIPKTGSTLAGLVAVQKEGWPELARYVAPDTEAAGVMVGQMTFTPAFLEAVQGYMKQYAAAVGDIMAGLESEIPEGFDWVQSAMKMMGESSTAWIGCYRGDFAGTFDLRSGAGMRGSQVAGIADASACTEMINLGKRFAGELPAGPDGAPMLAVEDNALQHKKVAATKQTFRFSFPGGMEGAEEISAMMSALFGEGGIETWYGMTDEYMIQATGPTGGDDFKALVDRVKAKKRKKAKMTGLTPALFRPLEVGPGFFMTLDFGRLMTQMLDVLPVEGEAANEMEKMKKFFGSLEEHDSRMAIGVRFEKDSVYGGASYPLDLVRAIGEMVAEEKARQETEEPREPSAAPGGEAPPETEITEG